MCHFLIRNKNPYILLFIYIKFLPSLFGSRLLEVTLTLVPCIELLLSLEAISFVFLQSSECEGGRRFDNLPHHRLQLYDIRYPSFPASLPP